MPRYTGGDLFNNQKGQVFLIVVLMMVVALTVGLSLASRSIVQVRTAQDEADSQKAFTAAEAGIEEVLKTGINITAAQNLGNNASINQVTIQNVQSNTVVLNNGNPVTQDDGVDIWLSDYSKDPTKIYQNPWSGTMHIYWGSVSACSDSALEIIVVSGTKATPIIARYAVDPCSTRRTGGGGNNLPAPTSSGGTINGQTFNFSTQVTVTSGLIARVIPLYTDTPVAVSGFSDIAETTPKTMPIQGTLITSVGASGNTQRKVTYFQGYESTPSELFYSLLLP